MKKALNIVLSLVAVVVFAGGIYYLSRAALQKYRWDINFFLYGRKEMHKQEFTYHSRQPVPGIPEPSSPLTPNVILISLDTMRAASMSCYGFAKKTAPFLEQLAGEGILFEQMCSASTSTPPSHMSMMTGLYLGVHGVLNRQVLDRAIKTLPEILSEAGYATGAVTENGFLVREMGFGRGFDDYYEIKDVELFEKLLVAGGFGRDVFERGKSWIKEKKDQRFFLFLHTYEVHTPYFPPPPYDTMFLTNPDDYRDHYRKFRQYKGRLNYQTFPPEFIRSQYEGEIGYTDELVRDFISFLKEQELERKTLVIITSDHGEELFEHNTIERHGYYTYDFESHIPFIMWMPGTLPQGLRIRNQVSNVDILPTVIDFLRLDLKDTTQGQSLIPLIRDPGTNDERQVFCEAVNQTCVRSLAHKFIDSNELYLYENDRNEQFNRAAQNPDLCARGTRALTEFKEQCKRLRSEKGLDKPGKLVDLTEKDINKLRALGYIN